MLRFGIESSAIGLTAVLAFALVIGCKRSQPSVAAEEGAAKPADVGPLAAFLELRCGADRRDQCAPGDSLFFDLQGTTGYRYFAAFVREKTGQVTWYFPEVPGTPGLALATTTGLVPDGGVLIPSGRSPGTAALYGVFSVDPLTRAQIEAAFSVQKTDVGANTQVVTRALTIR